MLHPRFIRPYLKEVGVMVLGATIMCINDQAHNKYILIVCVHIYLHENNHIQQNMTLIFLKLPLVQYHVALLYIESNI